MGTSPPFKSGFKKELHLDSYFKNLEYWCDKDWGSTKCTMKGLGYVMLPPWRKKTQLVHNILSSDELKPGKKRQKQINSYPCLREKAKKAKTNRWLFNHMAAVSAKKHDFIDLMYCLMQCTKINYTDDDPNGHPEDRCPRVWISKHKQSMEARHIRWRCGASLSVMKNQCHLRAEIDLGDNLVNPMHCRSIRGGDTRIVPKSVGGYECASGCYFTVAWRS